MWPSRRSVCLAMIALAIALTSFSATSRAAKTGFRFTDLDWRDPHFFYNIPGLGCTDITDYNSGGVVGINATMQSQMENDSNGDGKLDLSHLIVFDPLDQAGGGGALEYGNAFCTAPAASTTCEGNFLSNYPYTNSASECLGVLAGTANAAYLPPIVPSSSPCFVATLDQISINIAGYFISMTDAYLAATYSGDPASNLVNGLIRGFISQSAANSILVRSPVDQTWQPLSKFFRGGQNCCSQPLPAVGDKDTGPGAVSGWYVYLNFTATVATLEGNTSAVGDGHAMSLVLDAPMPNPFNPTTAIHYTLGRSGAVELDVYDASGRHVTRLASGAQNAGRHQTTWNGTDSGGSVVGSGVYFLRLASNGETRVQKLVLLK